MKHLIDSIFGPSGDIALDTTLSGNRLVLSQDGNSIKIDFYQIDALVAELKAYKARRKAEHRAAKRRAERETKAVLKEAPR